MECRDPNSGETRCGLPGVEETEVYCGDDATRACVEINVSPIGFKYRDVQASLSSIYWIK